MVYKGIQISLTGLWNMCTNEIYIVCDVLRRVLELAQCFKVFFFTTLMNNTV